MHENYYIYICVRNALYTSIMDLMIYLPIYCLQYYISNYTNGIIKKEVWNEQRVRVEQ